MPPMGMVQDGAEKEEEEQEKNTNHYWLISNANKNIIHKSPKLTKKD